MDVKGASKPLLILAVSAAALAGIGGYAWYGSLRPAVLELFVFDTPGAPAILIRTPHDKRILIDGGANSDVIERLTRVLPFYSRRIDMIIATKADAKNVTGLIDVSDRFQVDEAILPAVTLVDLSLASTSDPIYEIFEKTLLDKKVNTEKVAAGKRIILDQGAADDGGRTVTANILFPTSANRFFYSKASAPEIMMRIDYGTTSIMLAGSASVKIQKYVATTSPVLADVLIISNSALPSNVSSALVDSLAPDYLIYSQAIQKTAKKSASPSSSSKGKPQPDPLVGIPIDNRFNVRESGMIKIVSDGAGVQVSK